MNKKRELIYRAMIILLLIAIVATVKIYSNRPDKYSFMFSMGGTSKNWTVQDFEVFYSNESNLFECGKDMLIYKGDSEDIYNYSVRRYTLMGRGYTTKREKFIAGTRGGSEEIDIQSKLKGDEILKDIDENTYFIIEWILTDGTIQKEQVDLKIQTELKKPRELINGE